MMVANASYVDKSGFFAQVCRDTKVQNSRALRRRASWTGRSTEVFRHGKHLHRVLEISKGKWPELERRCLQSFGVRRHHQRRFSNRDGPYWEALKFAKQCGDQYGIAQLYSNMGGGSHRRHP